MREKVKNLIQYFLIGYMISIIILTIINMSGMKKTIELIDSSENIEKIKELKNEINNLEENSCKSLLNDMIKAYETTSFNGMVEYKKIHEIYWEGPSFLEFCNQIPNKCNISKEELYSMNMPYFALNSTSFIDNQVNKKVFDYELGIKDIFTRKILEGSRTNIDYKLSKQSEIIMIENILNKIGGNINE